MNFGLVIVGDEILSGRRQDKHLPKVIELLGARGLALSWARYVGDEPERITALLRDAFAGGDAVFVAQRSVYLVRADSTTAVVPTSCAARRGIC